MPRFKAMRLGLSVLFIAGVGLCVPCTEFPYAKLEEVIHSNLGGKGPHTGKEGLFFRVSLQNVGIAETAAEFHVHADGEYVPDLNTWNGLNGEWGRINFRCGANASFTAHFVKTGTDTQLNLHRGYLSFSDLDGDAQGKEFVAVSPFFGYYFAADNNWMATDTTSNPDFGITASYADNMPAEMGYDNLASSDKLTVKDKQKTITFQADYPDGFKEVKFMLGATTGSSSRTIQFNLQATMLCAKTLMPDGTEKEPTDLSGGNIFTRVFEGSGGAGDFGPLKPTDINSKYDICTGSGCSEGETNA